MNLSYRVFPLLIVLLLPSFKAGAQIFNFKRGDVYRKVFVETDDFDTSYLETLEYNLNGMPDDSSYFSVLNDLAYYWHTRNLNKALNFTKQGLKLARSKNDSLWEGRFQITQGAVLLRMENLDEAHEVLEMAKTKVEEKDLPFLNTQLGYVFERKGQLGKATDYALLSLRLGEKLKDKKAIALAYSDLSNLFWKLSKFEKGLEYGLLSLKYFEERQLDDLDYDFTLYVVGNNYLSLGNYEKALDYYNKSIAIGERYGFYNNLSDVYISITDLNTFLGNYADAEKAGVEAIRYAGYLDNNFMLMRSWLSVAKLQNAQQDFSKAISALHKSIEIATSDFGDEFFLSQAYEELGKAYAGLGEYEKAYESFLKFDALEDSIFTVEADERISLLQTQFEVAKKEGTIKVQEARLKQQRTWQMLISIIAALLLIILVILFISFRSNRKKRMLLQRKNEEKNFLLKEIHHRVKNNLETVSSMLSLQSAVIKDPKIIEVMKENQNRVHSMSMIHQRLYQGKNLSTIEMKEYLMNLGVYVLDSFGMGDRIEISYKMQPLELDIDTAIPLGLIVNELLTNSLKYAFTNGEKGKIIVKLHRNGEGKLSLKVIDNGLGKQESEAAKGTGFGTRLISLLTQQLDGIMSQDFTHGTSVSFEFNIMKAA
ncbi:sensor histidine kinase [Zunongwangia sp. H14]|uniref:sensor histidine kinase n=1 Tax=Zunongwangia sp. H14 TaxID=3240792 RepID=UPI0035620DF4